MNTNGEIASIAVLIVCVFNAYLGAEHNGHMSKWKIHKIQLADSIVLQCEYAEYVQLWWRMYQFCWLYPKFDSRVMTGKFYFDDINNTVHFELREKKPKICTPMYEIAQRLSPNFCNSAHTFVTLYCVHCIWAPTVARAKYK